ncbi:MAG: DUF444 family protein [Isosphaeraceae bacterium]
MARQIESDLNRFQQIVRGRVRGELKKYMTQEDMIGRQAGEYIAIPIPRIEIPTFRYGSRNSGGVGSGNGEIVTQGPIANGSGRAGDAPGSHIMEVEISLDELADIFGDELHLPRIQPKGAEKLHDLKDKYNNIRNTGPAGLRHFRKTYRQALKRQLTSSEYDSANPRIVPIRDDLRFRSWTSLPSPRSSAVIIYIMDVSGSMTDEHKAILRQQAFWINLWMNRHYSVVDRRFIIHDAAASEVNENQFFHIRESGGTRMSSGYKIAADIITQNYPETEWNIYIMQFSDGDNWGEDNPACIEILSQQLLPVVNQFAYIQAHTSYNSVEYRKLLKSYFDEESKFVFSEMRGREDIQQSIREILGRGQ